jgi:hypothetical protein
MVKFRKLTREEIAKLPPRRTATRSASQWDEALDAIAAGETIAIEVSSEQQLRGYRIGLARVAAREERKMKLDFREAADGSLVVSLSSEPFHPRNEQSPGPRRARKSAEKNNDNFM